MIPIFFLSEQCKIKYVAFTAPNAETNQFCLSEPLVAQRFCETKVHSVPPHISSCNSVKLFIPLRFSVFHNPYGTHFSAHNAKLATKRNTNNKESALFE